MIRGCEVISFNCNNYLKASSTVFTNVVKLHSNKMDQKEHDRSYVKAERPGAFPLKESRTSLQLASPHRKTGGCEAALHCRKSEIALVLADMGIYCQLYNSAMTLTH